MKQEYKVDYQMNDLFNDVDDSEKAAVYRYEPVMFFKENIRRNRLAFSAVTNWEDLLEQYYLEKFGRKSSDVACLCFTTNASENSAAAWKMRKNGDLPLVQVRYNLKKLVKLFEEFSKRKKCSVYIRKVEYLKDKEIKQKCSNKQLQVTDDEYVNLLSLKRKDFSFEGEIRIIILKENIEFQGKDFSKLYFADFADTKYKLSGAVDKISLEPFSCEMVRNGQALKRADDTEVSDMIDFVKSNISDKMDMSRFVQRKRLYEKESL